MRDGPPYARLEDWLDWQQRLHPATIDLGLERVGRVLVRTGWTRPAVPVITVGGTNGKGSCVALIDSILRATGRRVATFTSPHLVDYRERLRIDGVPVSAASLVAAFERIDAARGADSLTFFEFNTLAALLVFETARPDAVVLEVGLGGRLDAVNVVDADVAVVVSVGLDHTDWLGPDVESIGREKAGVFRTGRPAVYGGTQPPQALVEEARSIGALLHVRGRDFDAAPRADGTWDFTRGDRVRWSALPRPALAGAAQVFNAAAALMALDALESRLPLDRVAIERGLETVSIAGRFQSVDDPRGFTWIFDVAHNPDAARVLAANLRESRTVRRTLAVCGMLGDKDAVGVLTALRDDVDAWIATTPDGPRALADRDLVQRGAALGIAMQPGGDVTSALALAAREARRGDRVVVLGSFHTVGPALKLLGVPL